MRKSFYYACILAFALSVGKAHAQTGIAINDNNATADVSAMLDVSVSAAAKKGFLLPRMTSAQRDAISLPAKGLLIYVTGVDSLEMNIGTSASPKWFAFGNSSTSTGWLLKGNSGTTVGTNFLGTTDDNAVMFKVNSIESGFIGNSANGYAVSLGSGATIAKWSGTYATAIGASAKATSSQATAIGGSATAVSNSTAVGYASAALQDQTTAIGTNSTATAQNASAFGVNSTATAFWATALGFNSSATGQSSTAVGINASAGGTNSIAIGNGATVNSSASNSTAIGYGTSISNNASTATVFGYGASATNNVVTVTVVGNGASASNNVVNTTVIGNGAGAFNNVTNSVALGNGVTVSNSNTTAIGASSVTSVLFNGANFSNPKALVVGTDNTNGNGAYLTNGGVWTNASDKNLKESFSKVSGAEVLAKVMALDVTKWKYKGTNEYHIGPMAQDFFAAFSLGTDDKHISSLDPSGVALVAIQELKKENEELTKRVDDQQKLLEQLLKEVNELKAKVK